MTEIHNKDITQRKNNVENENPRYKETSGIHNNLYGDKVYGGAVASDGDSNKHYKLVNLDDADLDLQNLGMFGMFAGLANIGSKAGGEIWKNVDRKSYNKEGKKIMNGINQGAKIAEKLPIPFINMEQEQELQNLGMFKDLTGALGAGAQLGGQIWQAADPNSFNKQGKAIMGGIAAGSEFTGKLDDKFHLGKHTGVDKWDFMNLNQQPTTAIVASPE